LLRCPVIFTLHLRILIGYRRPVWISILICNRQHQSAAHPSPVEQGDQIVRSEWSGQRTKLRQFRTEQMLVIINRWLRAARNGREKNANSEKAICRHRRILHAIAHH
jgi:hypothetical protein